MARHVVLRAAELPEGESRIVTVRGREIAVFNLGGEFFAPCMTPPRKKGR